MQVITTRKEMREFAALNAGRIGFVPTMGYLHEGHMSLVRRAQSENAVTVVSIFVNPAQFNDPADLEKYPVDTERDLAMLRQEKVSAVFLPARTEVYPTGVPELKLSYPDAMRELCGQFRPGHFEGVLLVVHNLFMWVRPHRAYFGLKDYQQYVLIRRMATDLELDVAVVGCPVVRESDGLAMSSRNVRLSDAARSASLAISAALFSVEAAWQRGERGTLALRQLLEKGLLAIEVEYASINDAHTLVAIASERVDGGQLVVAVAANVGNVRLIDNILLS